MPTSSKAKRVAREIGVLGATDVSRDAAWNSCSRSRSFF